MFELRTAIDFRRIVTLILQAVKATDTYSVDRRAGEIAIRMAYSNPVTRRSATPAAINTDTIATHRTISHPM